MKTTSFPDRSAIKTTYFRSQTSHFIEFAFHIRYRFAIRPFVSILRVIFLKMIAAVSILTLKYLLREHR